MVPAKPSREIGSVESAKHHEEALAGKVVRLYCLQQRTEREFWEAIDKLGNCAQAHELLLHRIISRQWKLFLIILCSIVLQTLFMILQ